VLGFAAAMTLLLAVGLFYAALKRVPEFYREALVQDEAKARTASDKMIQRTSLLASDLNRSGRWQVLFTAAEINGWLAIDLVENRPIELPPGFESPRVAITSNQVRAACRVRQFGVESVVSLVVEPYLAEPDVIGLRFRGVRAGAVPLPLRQLLDTLTHQAEQNNLRVQWRQNAGDPVALISLGPPRGGKRRQVHIDKLTLGDGKLYVVGTTAER
jgi:hypothetical protein